MAIMYPESINFYDKVRLNDGEELIYELLRDNLPNEYFVYHRLELTNLAGISYRPDFIIVHSKGIIVIEVKDWSKNYIKEYSNNYVDLIDGKQEKNPLVKSQENMFHLINTLKTTNELKNNTGNFKSRYTHVAVYTNFSEGEFINNDMKIQNNNGRRKIITKDIIEKFIKSPNSNQFISLLDACFEYGYQDYFHLNKNEIDLIKNEIEQNIILSCNLSGKIKALDERQISLVKKSDNFNQILLRGATGTGKTTCLIARANYIAKIHKDFRILILCYNKPFELYLKETTKEFSNIEVRTIRSLLKEHIEYQDDYELKEKIENDRFNILSKYNVVYIDEGQDFKLEWIKFTKKLLIDENKSHFIMCIDSAQNIVSNINKSYPVKEVADEVYCLYKVYRNTKEIYEYAIEKTNFLNSSKFTNSNQMSLLNEWEDTSDYVGYYHKTEAIISSEEIPTEVNFNNLKKSINFIITEIKKLIHESEVNLSDIVIIYKKPNDFKNINNILRDNDINSEYYHSERNGVFNVTNNTVTIISPQSAKGLDYKIGFVLNCPELCNIQNNDYNDTLLFLAITRAREKVYLVNFDDRI